MEMELLKMVIDFVLDNIDVTDMDATAALITRLEIARNIITNMHPWDFKEVLPLVFRVEPTQEVVGDA